MVTELIGFDESDLAILRRAVEVMRRYDSQARNLTKWPTPEEPWPRSSGIFIVKTPSSGAAGAMSGADPPVVDSAACVPYIIVDEELIESDAVPVEVYNVSSTAMPTDTLGRALLDGFGTWFWLGEGTGAALQVSEEDGTPLFTPVRLIFDQDAGFTVTQQTVGSDFHALVSIRGADSDAPDFPTTYHEGHVNLEWQRWTGVKEFDSGMIVTTPSNNGDQVRFITDQAIAVEVDGVPGESLDFGVMPKPVPPGYQFIWSLNRDEESTGLMVLTETSQLISGISAAGYAGIIAYPLIAIPDDVRPRFFIYDGAIGQGVYLDPVDAGGFDVRGGIIVGGTFTGGGSSYTDEEARDAIAAMIAAGTHSGITFTYDDALNTLSATVTGSGYTDENAMDAVAAMILAGTHTGISFNYNDVANTFSAMVTAETMSWVKITKSYTDFSIAATNRNIAVYTLPAKGVIHEAVIHHTQNFTGPGLFSYAISLINGGNNIFGGHNVFSGQSGTNFGYEKQEVAYCKPMSMTATTSVNLEAVSSGANLSAATQGSVDVYLLVSTLP